MSRRDTAEVFGPAGEFDGGARILSRLEDGRVMMAIQTPDGLHFFTADRATWGRLFRAVETELDLPYEPDRHFTPESR